MLQGLALINGTQFITALGVEALERAQQVCDTANAIAAISLEVLKGTSRAFDEGKTTLISCDVGRTTLISCDESKTTLISCDESKTTLASCDECRTALIGCE